MTRRARHRPCEDRLPYIFGYLSLINSDSVRFSTHENGRDLLVPARLRGYRRVWTSYRHPTLQSPKHYIYLDTLDDVGCFSWATLAPAPGFVNGVCFETDASDIIHIDSREVGYTRAEVTERIEPYQGFHLKPGEPIYTYLSTPESLSLLYPKTIPYISADYVNMGFLGALFVDTFAPGFYKDYTATTDPVEAVIRDIRQVFWGDDGRRLYLLDEKDSSVILLHDFGHPVFLAHSNNDIHLGRPATLNLATQDLRAVATDPRSLYYECMHCPEETISSHLESLDPWVSVYLLNNPALTTKQADRLRRSGHFLARLILAYKNA